MEGETIKKKYTSILDMLKKERLTFSNQLEALESTIKKQDDEIDRLKNTQKVIKIIKPNWLVKCYQAALSTRDVARTSQQKQEVSLLSEGKDRDKKLSENRFVDINMIILDNSTIFWSKNWILILIYSS